MAGLNETARNAILDANSAVWPPDTASLPAVPPARAGVPVGAPVTAPLPAVPPRRVALPVGAPSTVLTPEVPPLRADVPVGAPTTALVPAVWPVSACPAGSSTPARSSVPPADPPPLMQTGTAGSSLVLGSSTGTAARTGGTSGTVQLLGAPSGINVAAAPPLPAPQLQALGGWLVPRTPPVLSRAGGTTGVIRVVGAATGRAHRTGSTRGRIATDFLATGHADTSSRRRRDEQALLAVL